MGNKSKQKNVNENIGRTVNRLYKRTAEMEIGLFKAGVSSAALIELLIDKGIISADEFNVNCNRIAKEILPNEGGEDEIGLDDTELQELEIELKEAENEIEEDIDETEEIFVPAR